MKSVLGIGNALVDIMTTVKDESLLHKLFLPKGSMTLVDRAYCERVLAATENLPRTLASGGSAANAIHGLAGLGVPTGFIGKTGSDTYGDFFFLDMESRGIKPYLQLSQTDSGRAIALVTEDSERTFATYLGAAVELTSDDLDPEVFNPYHFLHIEGYLVQNHDLMLRAMGIAKSKGLLISLDMASYNVVESNLEFLEHLLKEYVDIVFANEEEARAFTGLEPDEAIEILSASCSIAVVKVGKNGSIICQGDEKIRVSALPAKVLDTTGAGDLYASGFLYGLIHGHTLGECGECGSLMAGKVIEVLGAKIDEGRWEDIRRHLKLAL